MKLERKSCILIFSVVFSLGLLGAISVYFLYGNMEASRVLNLKRLPVGTYVTQYGMGITMDSMFECNLRTNPDQFQTLISGRDFVLDEYHYLIGKSTRSDRIPFYRNFEVSEAWKWSKGTEEYIDPTCEVLVNHNRTKVYVQYMTD